MIATSKKYSWLAGGHRFAILPISVGGYVVSINEQLRGFYPNAESAADDFRRGHIATIIDGKRPYLIRTREYEFPRDLVGWKMTEIIPIEIDEHPTFVAVGG